jgi:hypothetical protein
MAYGSNDVDKIEEMYSGGGKQRHLYSTAQGVMALWMAILLAAAARAQEMLPDSPHQTAAQVDRSNVAPAAKPKDATSGAESQPELVHAFWDKTNIFLFSGVAVMRTMDYVSTQNFLRRGRQEILLPQDVVENHAAFAAIEAAGTATSIGISYVFHRTSHHSLERWVSIVHISVTGFGDVRNYCLKSRHPQ